MAARMHNVYLCACRHLRNWLTANMVEKNTFLQLSFYLFKFQPYSWSLRNLLTIQCLILNIHGQLKQNNLLSHLPALKWIPHVAFHAGVAFTLIWCNGTQGQFVSRLISWILSWNPFCSVCLPHGTLLTAWPSLSFLAAAHHAALMHE